MADKESPEMPEQVREHVDLLVEGLSQLASGAELQEVAENLDRVYEAARDAAGTAGEVKRQRETQVTRRVVAFSELIAEHLRGRRTEVGWTQAQLAQAMTRLGFDWKRQTVAEVEIGTRRVSFEELLGLAALYSEPVLSLMRPGNGDYVRFPENRQIDPDDVQALLAPGPDVGPTWTAAARIARVRDPGGSGDWRPGKDLWQRRRAGRSSTSRRDDQEEES